MLSSYFHVNVHARSAGNAASTAMFIWSFDEVAEALAKLPRMFVEPDGSFVWVATEEPVWQIDGVLYDGGGRLWYAEIKGRCPEVHFNELLASLGWPKTEVVFQVLESGAQLDEAQFRRWAGWWSQNNSRRLART